MTDFKVGDKVRRVVESNWPEEYGVLGEVYTVLSLTFNSNYPVVIAGCAGSNPSAFELVEEVMQYEVGKPYLWFGGDCPLPKGTNVKIRYGRKDMSTLQKDWDISTYSVTDLNWQHNFSNANIVMFQVISYPQK